MKKTLLKTVLPSLVIGLISACGSETGIEAMKPIQKSADALSELAGNSKTKKVLNPVLKPWPGTFTQAVSLEMVAQTSGSEVYYTMDGSNPATNGKKYTGAITIAAGTKINIQAIATKRGMRSSDQVGGDYVVQGADSDTTGGGTTAPAPTGDVNVNFVVDASQQTNISRLIYGSNMYFDTGWNGTGRKFTFGRAGGNQWTGYNWELNASNAGSDWNHWNSSYLGGGDVPGMAAGKRIQTIQSEGGTALITVPMLDYVAADKTGDADVANTPDYLNVRFRRNMIRKGSDLSLQPDLTDSQVSQDEFVNWVLKTYGYNNLHFALDNEPDLWDQNHPRIRNNVKLSYTEFRDRSVNLASRLKEMAPSVPTYGPVLSGYYGFMALGGASDAGSKGFFVDWYLDQMRIASEQAGKRLLDVLDVHWYPEHAGSNNIRILEDDVSAETVKARVQAPRSLWDNTFKENSWISNDVVRGPVRLIPSFKEKIAAKYPGTKIAITEYYYGGGNHISGAIAQADVLGIFGREGVYSASHWHLGQTDDSFVYGAFRSYLNYDGANGRFGDKSLAANTSDVSTSSIYASADSSNPNRRVLVVINKKDTAQVAQISLEDSASFASGKTYVLSAGNANPVPGAALTPMGNNVFKYSMPAMSVTTIVLSP